MASSNPPPAELSDFPFAQARAIVREALSFYLPAERVSVAEHAAMHRYLNNRGGGFVGRWSHDEAPYLVGPMEALTGPQLTTAIVGPARSGKTTVGQNWLLQAVETDPADFLVYAQTDEVLRAYVKAEIEPMINLHKGMASRLGLKPKDRALDFKRFAGMWVQFLSATYNNLTNKSAPRIIITELDACDPSGEDTYALADIRRQTFGRDSMVLCESHPDAALGISPRHWDTGIMKLYRDSDRRTWWWPCPHCNAFSSPTPGAAREMALDYDVEAPLDEIEQQARLICPSCGSLIEDTWRRTMNKDAFWACAGTTVAENGSVTGTPVTSDIAGFWITGLMSPFMIGGIGNLAREIVRTKRDFEASGDDSEHRAVIVKRLGVPYTPPRTVRSVDAEALALREDPTLSLNRIPEGVRFLTASVDVQANRFELLIRGWGIDGESWIITYRQIKAEPATSAADWDALIAQVMETPIPLADGSGRGMVPLALGYDSGGEEGVTAQAYAAWRRARTRRLAKRAGMIEGRVAYSVLPLKGMSTVNAPLLAVRYPDSQRASTVSARADDVPLGQFNPNQFKDRLSSDLLITESGPRYVHFPSGLGQLHEFYDQLSAEERSPSGRWHKKRGGRRNEAWDLMVMSDVMAHLFGLQRYHWESPPNWAREWNDNPMITPLSSSQEESPTPSLKHPPAQTLPNPSNSRAARLERIRRQAARVGSLPSKGAV
ncbi:phage terminase large subunit family protein [Saccharibacter sp. EH611]|uniref:terminase gpA endonuclease subunit n=1 Tax=unclassified Saccharibacter TaxID=2648722 RepID=UPI00132635AF|nr:MULTISPECIES: terminase gpA endonuclease subunit [unclassified Saccharibacter]MXV35633.1 phage terminase large subunit family protein [Saccharibacter sp. EH611]MXV65755.1 phage terminase large subunit family protein [Saccharibacter sp. EH60]